MLGEACGTQGYTRDLNRILMTKRERKGALGRSKLRREDNIKGVLWKLDNKRVDWIELAEVGDRC